MDKNINHVRQRLGELAALQNKTQQAERKILADAQRMLADLEPKLGKARKAALGSDDGSAEYQEMIQERARLQGVIQQAKRFLGE